MVREALLWSWVAVDVAHTTTTTTQWNLGGKDVFTTLTPGMLWLWFLLATATSVSLKFLTLLSVILTGEKHVYPGCVHLKFPHVGSPHKPSAGAAARVSPWTKTWSLGSLPFCK